MLDLASAQSKHLYRFAELVITKAVEMLRAAQHDRLNWVSFAVYFALIRVITPIAP